MIKKFVAQVKMSNFVQVEFELPDFCNQSTIEIQAKIEAKDQYGDADEFEFIEIRELDK
jgi:hypothetical protein